jgi:hypothetical protein
MNIDLKICKNILKSSNPVFTEEMKQELKKVIDYEKTNANSIYQPKSMVGIQTANLPIYHYQKNNIGRFYAKKDTSIIPLSKYIKHTIFSYSKYKDLDQIKSNPSIAVEIGELNGIDFKNFKNYINNFDDIADKLIKYYSLPNQPNLQKSNIKLLFNIMIYGGGFKTWFDDLKKEKPEKNKKLF